MPSLPPSPSALLPNPLTNLMRGNHTPVNKKQYPLDLVKTLAGNLVKSVSNSLVYDPATKRPFPASPAWEYQDISRIQDPTQRQQALNQLAMSTVMAGTVSAPRAVGGNRVLKGLSKMPYDDVVALDVASERLANIKPDKTGTLNNLAKAARADIERLAEGYLGKTRAEAIFSKYKNANTAYRKLVDELQKLAGDTPPTKTPAQVAEEKFAANLDASGQKYRGMKSTEPSILKPIDLGDDLLSEASKYGSAEEFVNSRIKQYHQTSPESASAIEKEGFKLGLSGSGNTDTLPMGVNTKSSTQELGIQGRGSQIELGIDPNIKIKEFNDRFEAEKYFYNHPEASKYRQYVDESKRIDHKTAVEANRLLDLPVKTNKEGLENINKADKILDKGRKKDLEVSKLAQEEATRIAKKEGIEAIKIERDTGGWTGKLVTDNLIVLDPSKVKTKSQLTSLYNQAKGINGK